MDIKPCVQCKCKRWFRYYNEIGMCADCSDDLEPVDILDDLQSQLTQVTKERDEAFEVLLKLGEGAHQSDRLYKWYCENAERARNLISSSKKS